MCTDAPRDALTELSDESGDREAVSRTLEPELDTGRDPKSESGDRETVPVPEKSPEETSGMEFSSDSCIKDSAGGLSGGLASSAICKSFPS
jgi:hypothetical protein